MQTSATPLGDRYSRQIRFHGIGDAGHARLRAACVVVIGCGGLGSAVITLLARAGIGVLTVVDRDVVELSNLHRQVLYEEADADAAQPKAIAAAAAVARMNSEVRVRPVVADVTSRNVESIIDGAQVVIDATDNLVTRYLINDACVHLGIPWVYGGAVSSSGMSMTIIPGVTPCFRCRFPDLPPMGGIDTCDTIGVLSANVAAIAAHQWTEAVKLIVGATDRLIQGLLVIDFWANDHEVVTGVERQPDCPCCGRRRFEFLDPRTADVTITNFGRHATQISPAHPVDLDLDELRRRRSALGPVSGNDHVLRFVAGDRRITVFADGRTIIDGTLDTAEARSLYAIHVTGAMG